MDADAPKIDVGLELALATMRALAKRLGSDFVRDVRNEIAWSSERMAASDDPEARAAAPGVRSLCDAPIWADAGITGPP